ncbi:flagellar motor switch protein FliM [candidate division LCP-89 bacterium B3_LCP]|uniref:Flagellar motor switch protein FliM n=1 Tax=candidate division LCP-89 bacterium B3_LCP TaxID=2012998 RepID=A0A532V4U4_UNCL8|nr:MAG: flagellar motor switch protein FliM [candidate division LCP-89 bacterium B3_LCP]
MNKILSQEEIEALLSNVSESQDVDIDEEIEKEESKALQFYDFKHPDRISKDQIRSLRTLHENFSRLLATYLSTVLRVMVDVNLLSIDQVTYSEYTMSLSTPSSIYVLSSENLDGKLIIELCPALLLYMVDRLLGGTGDSTTESREITVIEQNVVRNIINNLIKIFNEVWSQAVDLDCKYSSFETDPQFVQIARSSDIIAVIFVEVQIKGQSYQMNICIPYYMLEPILPKLSSQAVIGLTKKSSESDSIMLNVNLSATQLPVVVQLAKARITIKDLLSFRRNDVIRLETRTDDELPVFIKDRAKYKGLPGRKGRHRAVQISNIIEPLDQIYHQ